MDDLAATLAGSFQVSFEPNTTASQHPRYAQYKSKGTLLQNNRREQLLEIQKQHRFDALAHARRLVDGDWKNYSEVGNESDEEEGMEVTVKKPGKYYKNQLMMSEWLVEVPDDFQQEWLMVLCPVAKRTLVVASKGRTVAYTKSGHHISSFPSYLPGGSRRQGNSTNHTILDCLFDEVNKTFWILDLMCWKSNPIYDSETEFRLYWLQQKLEEVPNVSTRDKYNPFSFYPLPPVPCSPEAIGDALAQATVEVDGLLFFHKRTHYTFGSTPLVVWLKPYMLTDVLNITVPSQYLSKKPDTYSNYAQHIAKVKENKHGNEHRRPHPTKPMTMEASDEQLDDQSKHSEIVTVSNSTDMDSADITSSVPCGTNVSDEHTTTLHIKTGVLNFSNSDNTFKGFGISNTSTVCEDHDCSFTNK